MPQLGAMIGGMIGNYVSPDVINGPSIGDAQQQTAQAGVPRPVVYGHPAPFAGNIIDGEAKARKIKVKRRDDGKGNQTITKEEHFILTYAIRICEGPIAGVARIWRNGKVVADFRADSMIPAYANGDTAARGQAIAEGRAATIKTMQKVRIYLGTEDQLPDPSLEAIHGVGNTPSYRGTAYIVITDDDVTDSQGAAAQWQFEVIGVGAPGGDASVVMDSTTMTTHGVTAQTAQAVVNEFRKEYSVSSVTEIMRYFTDISPSTGDRICPVRYIVESYSPGQIQDGVKLYDTGWLARTNSDKIGFDGASWSVVYIFDTAISIGTPIETLVGANCIKYVNATVTDRACVVSQTLASETLIKNFPTTSIRVRQLIAGIPTINPYAQGAGQLSIQYVQASELPASYTMSPDTPGLVIGDDGKLYYPDWDTSASFPTITPTAITVAGIVDDLANRSGVPDAKIDTSAIAVPVPGMLVATQCTASEAVKPLQQIYFFDMPEFDGKIRAVLRGGAIKATVTDADMVFSEGDTTRAQHVEFPLAVTVVCRSPEAEYSPLPQTSRRSSNNVTALGESRIESPIPMSPNEAMKRADILQKAMWARSEGTAEKWFPDQFSYLVPSDCIVYQGKRWLIENVSLLEGKMKVVMVNDRAGAYQSTALAAPIRQPDLPASSLAEPTILIPFQSPAIRADDAGKTGFYVVASGDTDAWRGCLVQMSLNNGATIQDVVTITVPSENGKLTNSVTTASSTIDIALDYGELYTTDAAGLAVGANAGALIPASTIAELIQHTTATETTPDVYSIGGLSRGRLGTANAAHGVGERYAMVSNAVFIPLDASFVGQTVMVRGVTSGTAPSSAPWITFTLADLRPTVTTPMYLINSEGSVMFNSSGDTMFVDVPV